MRAGSGGSMALLLVVVAMRPAAGDDCREEDRDMRGNCPAKTKPPQPKTTPKTTPKPTRLDIHGGSELAGARVSLDGQAAGRAPAVLDTAPGRHLVEVSKDDYVTFSQWVEVAKGEVKRVVVRLQPKPSTGAPQVAKSGGCPAGMVRVMVGIFRMGSPDGQGNPDENPQHTVTLSGYCIDKTEVTVKAFAACVSTGVCSAATEPSSSGMAQFCNGSRADRTDHPVNCVDWNQATAYCTWAGKRLPTEAEWEYAARGSDGRRYPWGNDAPTAKRLNACGTECVLMQKQKFNVSRSAMYDGSDGWEATSPVGSFPDGASPFGALDMAGNVWEWTADRYGPYATNAATNPNGATSGDPRSIRGGGWHALDADGVRAAYRSRYVPGSRDSYLGFRCARGD